MPRKRCDRPDAALILACRDGDAAAWEALIERYGGLVYSIPRRYGLSDDECDDVFQSVWLALLNHLDHLRQPDRVASWLVTTSRRACWDRRRGADFAHSVAADPAHLLRTDDKEAPSPEELVAGYEQARWLKDAVEQLDRRCRQLLQLLYFSAGNPSYADVAQRLAMPVGAIGPTRARCLEKLRRLLT